MTRITTIVDNESHKDNTLCIALLYRYRTHTFTQIFIESRINYVSNCKNFMLFVCVIFVSGIFNFVVTSCTISIWSTYCHELTARDAIFGLKNDNKKFNLKFFFVLGINFTFQTRINTYTLILEKDFRESITKRVCYKIYKNYCVLCKTDAASIVLTFLVWIYRTIPIFLILFIMTLLFDAS